MFESRCGIACDRCDKKEEVGCKGCLNMKLPFWGGQCLVKSCCEKKELNHCGECDLFPCEMEATMGEEMGYDPKPRLDNCRNWR